MQRPLDETAALRIVVEAMPVGVSWARLSDQKILFINRKFTEIFGYESGEFANIAEWIDRTYLFEEDRELVARTWGAHLAAKEHTQASIEPVEIRVLCKDGEVKTILNSGVILPETAGRSRRLSTSASESATSFASKRPNARRRKTSLSTNYCSTIRRR